jgi:sensor c-di-GMP phosphodiesterase-like protein
LRLDVVAEGIELHEQIVSLRDLGCELGQGFLFSKPMNQEDLVEYLDAGEEAVGEPRPRAA